jgi:hypothetical protein
MKRHLVECGDSGKRQADVFELEEVGIVTAGSLAARLE